MVCYYNSTVGNRPLGKRSKPPDLQSGDIVSTTIWARKQQDARFNRRTSFTETNKEGMYLDENIGKRIGIYEVVHLCDYKSNDGHKIYHVRCSVCGWETNCQLRWLKIAKSCRHKSASGRSKFDHVDWKNKRIASIFRGMECRCYNKNDKMYRFYGAKGIEVCDEWLENPKSFEIWSLENGYADDLTIDRIDSGEDYSPENCRWVTSKFNARYKSTTRLIEVDGVVKTGREWAKALNLGLNTINMIVRKNGLDCCKKFIQARLADMGKVRKPEETWLSTYEIT